MRLSGGETVRRPTAAERADPGNRCGGGQAGLREPGRQVILARGKTNARQNLAPVERAAQDIVRRTFPGPEREILTVGDQNHPEAPVRVAEPNLTGASQPVPV